MFDKMTNLALSSFSDIARMALKIEKMEKPGLSKEEEAQLPGFIPSNIRYVCGATYCDYSCLKEFMLRYHILALHNDESLYTCTHCMEKLSSDKGVINVDHIIKHLTLLYKCSYCKFLHNLKHKVDRHVLDKHTDKPPIVIIVREMDHEPDVEETNYNVKCIPDGMIFGKEVPVPAIAPVNPVPCLEKNEKMFGKMTNLELSSLSDIARMALKIEKMEKPGLSKEEEAQPPGFIPSNKRYVCGASYCDYLYLEESMLRCHLLALHSDESLYKCTHCTEKLSSDKGVINVDHIIKHLRLHDLHLYKCSYCKFLHNLKHKVDRHVLDKHTDKPPIVIIVREMDHEPEEPPPEHHEEIKETKPWRCGMCKYRCITKNEITAHVFNKHDMESQHKCALCKFKSNTKSSFAAHFEAAHPGQSIDVIDAYYEVKETNSNVKHIPEGMIFGKEVPVPAIAPVNPVPCLEKNEKMFGKMTNLTLSSFSDIARMALKIEKMEKPGLSKEEEAQLPGFIPSNKRYVCGASYCDYLYLEESMLRCHLLALHSDESLYKCTHCTEKLSSDKGVINVDHIIKHLRLHDLHLYKCSYCKFLHNLKHKVDRHVLDKHTDKPPIVIIVREMDHEPEEPPPEHHEEIKETKPWRCGMCKYRCITKNEITAHVFNKHDMESQHKCALCKFKSDTKFSFAAHFEAAHPGQSIDVIDAYYEVKETNSNVKHIPEGMIFDTTTPLWQRDKNKFKHIRGIPVDKTNKIPKKSPIKSTNSFDNLDKALEEIERDPLKPKKLKTLKEKKMEISKNDESSDVIEIDDDIIDVVNLVEKGEKLLVKNSDKNVTDDSKEIAMAEVDQRNVLKICSSIRKDQEATKLSLQEIQKLDLDKLRNCELSGSYGPFGKPFNKQYLCPLCGTFKTKKTEETKNRNPFATLLSPRGTEVELKGKQSGNYDHLKISFEEASTPDSSSTFDLESPGSKGKMIHQCKCCNYSCKAASDLRKHEKRHWVQKRLKCGYCDFEGVTNYDVILHSKRAHADMEPRVIAVPTPSTPTIKPITRKRKYTIAEINQEATASEEAEIEVEYATVVVCNYCPKRCDSEADMKVHWEFIHKSRSPIFKFKTLSKTKSEPAIQPQKVRIVENTYEFDEEPGI